MLRELGQAITSPVFSYRDMLYLNDHLEVLGSRDASDWYSVNTRSLACLNDFNTEK